MESVICDRKNSLSKTSKKRSRFEIQAECKEKRHQKRRKGGSSDCLRDDSVLIDLTQEDAETLEAVSQPLSRHIPYDTCFGVINFMASVRDDPEVSPMNLPLEVRPSGETLRLFGSSSEQVGAIICPTLCELVEKFQVTLKTFISMPQILAKNLNGSWRVNYDQRAAKVVVYGMNSEKRDVAYFLSDGDLFLQHPSFKEYDATVPYFNPQYLPGPDGSMPAIEYAKESAATSGQNLTETEKAHLLQLFETSSTSLSDLKVSPSPRLRSTLKSHQLSALAMMVEKERGTLSGARYPTIWRRREENGDKRYYHITTGLPSEQADPIPIRGGLLADEMGLGKTLSVLSLVAWHLDNLQISTGDSEIRPTLIVTPKSTIPEWEQQVTKHMVPGSITLLTYVGTSRAQLSRDWNDKDIVLTTYDTLRSERISNGPVFRNTWARVILDEAHVIRNRTSQIYEAACATQSPRRWCLTGTPIQNTLDDFGALLAFIGVPPFTDERSFKFYIADPIQKKEKTAFSTLRKLIGATCLRRTKALALKGLRLPAKKEILVELDFDEETAALYQFFTDKTSALARSPNKVSKKGARRGSDRNILTLIGILRLICNHGKDLLPDIALNAWKNKTSVSVDWNMLSRFIPKCVFCKSNLEELDTTGGTSREFSCGHAACSSCCRIKEQDNPSVDWDTCPECNADFPYPSDKSGSSPATYIPSVKVQALLQHLKEEQLGASSNKLIGPTKSVIFSYWTKMVDLIEIALKHNGLRFSRIDGQTSLLDRKRALDTFNNDTACRIMLATIGSAGQGVNMTVATYVHLMEPQWNPMIEAQAVDRVHRIGQNQDVVIRRYTIKNSIENYVRWVQNHKLQLIHSSLSNDAPNQHITDKEHWNKLADFLKTETC